MTCFENGNGEQINLELESIERIKPFGIKRQSPPSSPPYNVCTLVGGLTPSERNYIAIGVDFPAHHFVPFVPSILCVTCLANHIRAQNIQMDSTVPDAVVSDNDDVLLCGSVSPTLSS